MGVTERSKSVTEMIFERTPIIIYQMVNDVHKRRKELIHDEKYVQRHLKVMQAKDLKITRVFKYTGEKNVQLTTACADRVNFGIFISDAKEIDYYDIAMALCNLLFAKVQFNDAIIAERYLTASLYNLRRKGVPVDRILNLRKHEQQQKQLEQQQQQKQAIEAARATPDIPKKAATPPPAPPPLVNMPKPLSSREMDKCTKQVQDVFGDCQEGYIRQLLAQQQDNHAQNVIERLLREDYPKKNQVESPNSIVSEEEQEAKKKQVLEANKKENERNSGFVNRLWSSWKQPAPTPPKPPIETKPVIEPKKPKLPKSEKTITPNYTNNVRENLKRAIHSCKPFAGQDIYTPPRINNINESASYCDATPGQNLTYVGNVLGMEFYVHRDVNPDDVLELHKQAMTQFNSILKELATVFDLKLSTIQIFYDTEGPTIAFNTSGSLFMNLRYYLALHSNQRKEALIYWFMTLCHELAHNFVTEHSSQHEFYMSSFAENYLEALMAHIYNIEKDALPITNVK
jgi:hypothetical protein